MITFLCEILVPPPWTLWLKQQEPFLTITGTENLHQPSLRFGGQAFNILPLTFFSALRCDNGASSLFNELREGRNVQFYAFSKVLILSRHNHRK